MPVRSESTQPELPSITSIRLLPSEAKIPTASGPPSVPVFAATIVLPMLTTLLSLSMPPPSTPAELPLRVQLVSAVVLSDSLSTPPPFAEAELPLTVQFVSVVVPSLSLPTPPPELASLSLTLQLTSVVVPRSLNTPPPPLIAELPLTAELVNVVVPS